MTNSSQFYFSVEKLENLLLDFKSSRSNTTEKKILRGFVFTPGEDEEHNPACFAFPLFSDNIAPGRVEEGAFVMLNTKNNVGCPYPPPCPSALFVEDKCYGKDL